MTDPQIASLSRFGDAPFFVFCDHAANAIPADLHCLGLPADLLQTHIAWDIGAGALSRLLAEQLGGTLLECGFSRLIIDVNRDLTSHDLIPAASDQIPVPGNQMMTEAERKRRIETLHAAYHERLSAALDEMTERSGPSFFAVSVHSYTNRLMGAVEDRPWEVGFLWRDDEISARAAMRFLARKTGWTIGDNEPYDARVFNYSVDRHLGPRGLPHLTLEVRQDLIGDDAGVAAMADALTQTLRFAAAAHDDEAGAENDGGGR